MSTAMAALLFPLIIIVAGASPVILLLLDHICLMLSAIMPGQLKTSSVRFQMLRLTGSSVTLAI